MSEDTIGAGLVSQADIDAATVEGATAAAEESPAIDLNVNGGDPIPEPVDDAQED